MTAMELLLVGAAVVLAAKSLGGWSQAVLNDARMISLDPALTNKLEILFAYPGEVTHVGIWRWDYCVCMGLVVGVVHRM